MSYLSPTEFEHISEEVCALLYKHGSAEDGAEAEVDYNEYNIRCELSVVASEPVDPYGFAKGDPRCDVKATNDVNVEVYDTERDCECPELSKELKEYIYIPWS